MSRVPILDTEAEVIAYHVNLYYDNVTENPSVRADEQKHIALIEHVNERYIKALGYVPPGSDKEQMDFDRYQGSFIENMDYLTGVFRKKREREALSDAKKAFRERNAKKSKFV